MSLAEFVQHLNVHHMLIECTLCNNDIFANDIMKHSRVCNSEELSNEGCIEFTP